MKLSLYDAFDMIAKDAVEILTEYDSTQEEIPEYSPEAVIQDVLGESKKKRKKWRRQKGWKRYFLIAAVVAALSSVSFAMYQRNVQKNNGAQLVDETNRDLVGRELTGQAAEVWDTDGNLKNAKELVEFYGECTESYDDWRRSSLIHNVHPNAHIPYTTDEFAVLESEEEYITPEVIFTNDAMVIFTKKDGSGWQLKKDETLIFEAEEYPSEIGFGKGQAVLYQYILNGTLMPSVEGQEKNDGLKLVYTLTADRKGEYYICLVGASSDPITMKEGKIYTKY